MTSLLFFNFLRFLKLSLTALNAFGAGRNPLDRWNRNGTNRIKGVRLIMFVQFAVTMSSQSYGMVALYALAICPSDTDYHGKDVSQQPSDVFIEGNT